MLDINGVKVLTDREILDNVVGFIKDYYGSQDWEAAADTCSSVVGHAIGWNWETVRGYLLTALGVRS